MNVEDRIETLDTNIEELNSLIDRLETRTQKKILNEINEKFEILESSVAELMTLLNTADTCIKDRKKLEDLMGTDLDEIKDFLEMTDVCTNEELLSLLDMEVDGYNMEVAK